MNSSLPQNIPVRVEKPEGTLFGDILNDMRAWLDDNDIQPVLFKSIPMRDGGYVFYLHFQTEDEASKFRSRFDVKLDDTLDDLRKGTLTAVNSPLEKQPHILIVDDDSAV